VTFVIFNHLLTKARCFATGFVCNNGRIIPTEKFCDGIQDCDGSDELQKISDGILHIRLVYSGIFLCSLSGPVKFVCRGTGQKKRRNSDKNFPRKKLLVITKFLLGTHKVLSIRFKKLLVTSDTA